jgi:16S rRNA (cytosine1402-N4)-methyltransferase
MSHKPVMLQEVLQNLKIKDGETYLDCTFGAGGYSTAILESANCHLYAIDRDALAENFAEKLHKKFPKNFTFLKGNFSNCSELLAQENISEIDGMVLDIGVSSMQLDDHSRGFSFDSDEKLDMRMDRTSYPSAFEVVNEMSEADLTRIIKEFGEEPKARQIAKRIVAQRVQSPITSCRNLASIVRSLYTGYSKTDAATRTFQAIRIFVNQELDELRMALKASLKILKKGGRLVVVSFHSLEDAIVKNFLKEEAGLNQTFSRYQPITPDMQKSPNFQILTKSAISPTQEEINNNIRARSAKMRVAIRM